MVAMSRVWVRDATDDDVPLLVDFIVAEALESEARGVLPDVARAAVTAVLRDPALARYWLVQRDDAVLGAISAGREWSDWNNAAYWWIQFVFVVPAARGQGLLEEMVDEVKRAASAGGAAALRLYVHPDNARAIRAYERLGFAGLGYRIMGQSVDRAAEPAGVLDDGGLWRRFHDRTLCHAQWTHAAHLRIAWLHLARYELDEAHLRMRAGILRLNAAHGLVETPQRGYHETLTRAWLRLVAAARRRGLGPDSMSALADPALERNAPLAFYSRDRLFSLEARAMYVPPDLAELP
jgi:ribosomal protein S18 acetylase RimI-like enzyme